MINIYGLKNCDSCRKAIKWLKDNNYSYEFFDIKVNPIKINYYRHNNNTYDRGKKQ